MREDCTFNDNGSCMGQKDMPPCTKECSSYRVDDQKVKNLILNIRAGVNWEKICRYLIKKYNIHEDEIISDISKNILDFVDVKLEH